NRFERVRRVAIGRAVVQPRVRRARHRCLPLCVRRQPLARARAGLLRLEPGDVRRRPHPRQTHRVDVVGAVLPAVRARRVVVVAADAELRRASRRLAPPPPPPPGPPPPPPAGSSSPAPCLRQAGPTPATRSPRTCPCTPRPT